MPKGSLGGSPGWPVERGGSLQHSHRPAALELTGELEWRFYRAELDFYVRNAGKWFRTFVKLGGKAV